MWDRQVNAIIDIKLGDADADSYKYEPMTALLDRWETIKNDKHGKHCHYQWRKIAVCSLDGNNSREVSPGRAIATESSHGR